MRYQVLGWDVRTQRKKEGAVFGDLGCLCVCMCAPDIAILIGKKMLRGP